MPDLTIKPRIIILGGGLGGAIAAFDLDEKMQNSAEITVVSDRPEFSFTPSNPWVAVGWREPSAIQIDLAKALGRRASALSPKRQRASSRRKTGSNSPMTPPWITISS